MSEVKLEIKDGRRIFSVDVDLPKEEAEAFLIKTMEEYKETLKQ